MAEHADTIVWSIKRPGKGEYLEALFRWAGITDPFRPPVAQAGVTLVSSTRHMAFQTMPVPFEPKHHPWDDIVLEQVIFAAGADLPFGLDAASETPDSASLKLGRDRVKGDPDAVTQGDRRVSYFMFDATVMEITFRTNMTGVHQVLAARLG